MNYRMVGLLSAGHLVTDLNQGAIPALLPFLIVQHEISYAAAAGIVFAVNITSTVIQPLFGYLADQVSKTWVIPTGLFLAGLGLALTGVASHYVWLILAAVLSGIGIAAFHPEAARFVNFAGGKKKATAMSIFGVGGTLGFALGPLLITTSVLYWDLNGTLVMLIPVSIIAVIALSQSSQFSALEKTAKSSQLHKNPESYEDNWGAFARLTVTVVGRSIIFYGLITFIPLYWIKVLHQSETFGGAALTLLSISGVVGSLLGGRLSDRFGHVKIIIIGCALLIPCLPALIWVSNVYLATLLLIPVGMLLSMTYGPTIVMGQQYLPNHIGLSSGVTLGVAFSIGGMAAPLMGVVADHYGIWYALASIAFIPILVTGMACTMPALESKSLGVPKESS